LTTPDPTWILPTVFAMSSFIMIRLNADMPAQVPLEYPTG
jgi:hypothetical protein